MGRVCAQPATDPIKLDWVGSFLTRSRLVELSGWVGWATIGWWLVSSEAENCRKPLETAEIREISLDPVRSC